jgi:sugar phosphate isomerase/epimerase
MADTTQAAVRGHGRPETPTRRVFLAALCASAAARAAALANRLSITVRIAEAPGSTGKTILGFEDLVQLAKKTGYGAIDMRASQAGIQTPMERLRQMRGLLDAAGLRVSMVTGDFDIPPNNDDAPRGLRRITSYLDLAETLGSDLIRIAMKRGDDIRWAQRASDEARERKIRLAHQSHQSTLFETVAGAVDALKRVNRPNFGIIYEAGNWMACGQDYGPKTIGKIRPWLMNVYVQNYRISPAGKTTMQTWYRGPVRLDPIGSWETGGVDYPAVFKALHAIGYSGYITAFGAFSLFATPGEAAARSYQYLKPLIT